MKDRCQTFLIKPTVSRNNSPLIDPGKSAADAGKIIKNETYIINTKLDSSLGENVAEYPKDGILQNHTPIFDIYPCIIYFQFRQVRNPLRLHEFFKDNTLSISPINVTGMLDSTPVTIAEASKVINGYG